MRTVALFSVLLLAGCGAVSGTDAGLDSGVDSGLDSGVVDAGSPVVDAGTDAGVPDGGVLYTTLRVNYPAGTHQVFARGSLTPLSWNTGVPMTKENDTTWSLVVPALPAGAALEWKPLLDDTTWSKGPNYGVTAGGTSSVFPRFLRDVGEWSRLWTSFSSTLLMNTRGVWVYFPPTYLENSAARMPVVYMHDGQNLFDPAYAFGGNTWLVPQTMDSAANDGRFREALIIGVENTSARMEEYTPTFDSSVGAGGKGALYLRMLVEELKPMVDSSFRTLSGPGDTVLIGSSLGGLISAYAGTHQAATFGNVGVMSPSTWWDNNFIVADVASTGTTRPLRVYLDSGDSGPSNDDVTETATLASTYRSIGYVEGRTLHYVVQAGATHTESAWASRLPGALEFLLGPGR